MVPVPQCAWRWCWSAVLECGNREPLQDSKAQLRTHFLGEWLSRPPRSQPEVHRHCDTGLHTPHALSTPVSSYHDSFFAWSVFCSVKHWYFFFLILTLYFHANWGFVEDSLVRLPIKHFKAYTLNIGSQVTTNFKKKTA